MNAIIEKLILQITYVCLHITSQGKWHAHFSLSAHVRKVDVYVLPASQVYAEGVPHVRAFDQGVYYQSNPDRRAWPHDIEQQAIAELQTLLDGLEQFLQLEQLGSTRTVSGTPPRIGSLDDASMSTITGLALAGGQAELVISSHRQDHRVQLTVDRFDVPTGYALEAALDAYGQRHTLKLSPGDGIYAARLAEWVESIATGTAAAA